jgi:hypothetical protein
MRHRHFGSSMNKTGKLKFISPAKKIVNRQAKQGGISFSTNQRFCLHFCPKPIRMRKTVHHMKFDNKRMGVTSELFCKRFFCFLL